MRANEGVVRAGRYVRDRGASELLYGVVVAGSMLAVSSAHATGTEHVAIATTIVAVTYWLAHVYVDAVGHRAEGSQRHTGHLVAEALRTNTGVLVGALPPIVVFLLARVFDADIDDAALVALVFTVAMLVAAGGLAAYRAGARGRLLLGETAISGAFGLLVIGLKYAVH